MRFPTSRICGCTIPCKKSQQKAKPDRILDGLFLGPIECAFNAVALRAVYKVSHVVDCSFSAYTRSKELKYLVIDIVDEPSEDIARHFKASCAFIDAARKGSGCVYVHCSAGVSRSPTLVRRVVWLCLTAHCV